MPTGVVWAAGSVVETTIFLKANHAGGWMYRLCKVGENLTEVGSCPTRTLHVTASPILVYFVPFLFLFRVYVSFYLPITDHQHTHTHPFLHL